MAFEESKKGKSTRRPRVFISYSRSDKRSLKELHAHLDHYALMKEIEYWDDTMLQPGAKWREEIQKALKATTVAVLLVSPEFLASDFIMKNELPPLLKSSSQYGTLILCVILRYCAFKDTNLAEFQAMNPPSLPMSEMSRGKRDAVWAKVAKLIKKSSFPQQSDDEN
jgi:internalin A